MIGIIIVTLFMISKATTILLVLISTQRRITISLQKMADWHDEFLSRQAAFKAKVQIKSDVRIAIKVKPPPAAVKTIRELIYWEYAKLIAKAAGFDKNYRFIMSKYMKLKNKQIRWSDLNKDYDAALLKERECAYCHSKEDLSVDHIIPLKRAGFLADIPSNKILCCKACNSSKLDKDIFEWYYTVKREEEIPRAVWSKYLKLVWEFHTMNRTLDRCDLNKDGRLDILDLGSIFKTYEQLAPA
jgi:hypothetical protein